MNYLEPQDSHEAIDSFVRAADFMKKFGRQTFESEEWELIKIKQAEIYVLLHSKKETDLFVSEKLKITIIPLTSLGNDQVDKGEEKLLNLKVWGVEIDRITAQAKFCRYGAFEIQPDELKNQGLGSYVLSKLVGWVKNYPSEFKVQILGESIDENHPNNSPIVKKIAQKFNLLKAQNISELINPTDLGNIESLPITTKFLSEILQENISWKQSNKELKQRIKELNSSDSPAHQLKNSISTLIALVFILIIIVMAQ